MKDLTEVDEFSSPITVPENTDSRNDAAGDVERIAQRLANRTKYLQSRVGPLDADAARKSQENTFQQGQYIDVPEHAPDWPLLRTHDDPSMYTGTMPGGEVPSQNRWKVELAFPTHALGAIGLFAGQPPEAIAWTANVRWHPSTQRWRQLDPGLPSMALVGRTLKADGSPGVHFFVSYKAPGSAPWATWPIDLGGDFFVGGDASVAGLYRYHGGAHTHWVQLWPEGGPTATTLDRVSLNPGQTARYRVRLPTGAKPTTANIKIGEIVPGSKYTLRTYQHVCKPFNNTDPDGVTLVTLDEKIITNSGATVVNHVLDFDGVTVDNEFSNYWVFVRCDAASANMIDAWAAQVGFIDPGPRNH